MLRWLRFIVRKNLWNYKEGGEILLVLLLHPQNAKVMATVNDECL